jgi:hypothetical protein
MKPAEARQGRYELLHSLKAGLGTATTGGRVNPRQGRRPPSVGHAEDPSSGSHQRSGEVSGFGDCNAATLNSRWLIPPHPSKTEQS